MVEIPLCINFTGQTPVLAEEQRQSTFFEKEGKSQGRAAPKPSFSKRVARIA